MFVQHPAALRLRISSALGVEHPRSSIVSRNLAIVKAIKGRPRCSTRGGREGFGTGGKAVDLWEKGIWQYLGNRQGASLNENDVTKNVPSHNGIAHGTARVIPGGFFFAGKLPAAGVMLGSSSNESRKKKGVKKRGKSARRR